MRADRTAGGVAGGDGAGGGQLLRDPRAAPLPPTEEPVPILYAGGASSVFHRARYEALGGLDTLYHPFYWEDIELGYRAWRVGWRSVFEPRASVFHRRRATIGPRFGDDYANQTFLKNVLLFVLKNVRDRRLLSQHFAYVCALAGEGAAGGRPDDERGGAAGAAAARPRCGAPPVAGAATRRPDGRRGDGAAGATAHAHAGGGGAMKILFVSPFLPYPPVAGGHAEIWGWMKRLAARHELAFVGFYEREAEAENVAEVARLCVETRARLRQPTPHAYGSFAERAGVGQRVLLAPSGPRSVEVTESFQPDVVQYLSTNMAQYRRTSRRAVGGDGAGDQLRRRTPGASRRSPGSHDCRRGWNGRGCCATRRGCCGRRRTSSDVEERSPHRAGGGATGGGDGRPARRRPGGARARARSPEPGRVLYLGHMEHYPNLDGLLYLYQDIWPLVRQAARRRG